MLDFGVDIQLELENTPDVGSADIELESMKDSDFVDVEHTTDFDFVDRMMDYDFVDKGLDFVGMGPLGNLRMMNYVVVVGIVVGAVGMIL